jgi:hypothetical protein
MREKVAQPETISELIDRLGGTNRVAAALGIKVNAISNWRVKGAIPPRYFLPLSMLCRNRCRLAPEWFRAVKRPEAA